MMRSNPKLIKKKVYCETRTGKNDANKDRQTTLIKISKKKVTKFISEKNFPAGKKKKVPPLGQTLGSSHFGETPLSLGGGDYAVCCIK